MTGPRLRLQFSLTALVVAITLLCVWLGFRADASRKQRAILELVQQRGGHLVFQHQHEGGIVIPLAHP